MKKRLLAAVLAATTVLLSACGSGNASSTASGNGRADHLAKIQKAGKLVLGLEGVPGDAFGFPAELGEFVVLGF